MDLGIKDKVALITGGSRGIGKSAAIELAKEGCHISIIGRNKKALRETEEELSSYNIKTVSISANLETAKGVQKAVSKTLKKFNKIDILFNNAGHSHPCTPISATDKEWESILNIHLMACVRTCRLVIPGMIERKWGRIINMSSMHGLSPGLGVPDYSTAKAAVINYTNSLAMEYSKYGICANSICPGLIHTEIWDKYADSIAPQYNTDREGIFKITTKRASAVKRYAHPSEVGKVVTFLASECASFITGCPIQVDGGALCGIEFDYDKQK
ncbi:MAG TPA: SDR family NAD(P)-dependent oxidoreductase [Victivallales bacterium]|nr:SDR family NAD(P)-dependent oxidoreductase [Victivallales bacterium]